MCSKKELVISIFLFISFPMCTGAELISRFMALEGEKGREFFFFSGKIKK